MPLHTPRPHLVTYAIGLLLLIPGTSSALELGEASIKSGLGESLLVEIPYRLSGSEQVVSACVGLASEQAADGLPTIARASRISVTPTHIQIYDERRVLEPLIGLNVEVHCASAPHLMRSYQLFVDPPTQIPAILSNGPEVAAARTQSAIDATAPVAAPVASPAAPVTARALDVTPVTRAARAATAATNDATASTASATTARADVSPRARGLEGGNLPQGQTYRVVRGDTLSGIAARITERPVTITQAADAIFAANPAAFTRGNPDLIEEGRSITIPNLGSQAALAAPATPAPVAIREADLPTAAPAVAIDPVPAPPSTAPPLRADDAAGVATPAVSQSLPTAEPTVATPSAAPVAAPTSSKVAPVAARPAVAGWSSGWLIALLAVVAALLLWASVAFVRRRREQQAEALVSSNVKEPTRRRPVELASRMQVVEGSMTGTHTVKQTPALRDAEIVPVGDSSGGVPPDLDLALAMGETDAVDFNVGDPVAATEPVDEANRAYIIDARDDTMEEDALTARMPDVTTDPTVRQPPPSAKPARSEEVINDEKHTLTVVELDILRQDYEAEHTLTQQSSQALRDAVADLEATKKSRAATAETATLESPLVSDTIESAVDAPTARIRAKK